MAVSFAGRWQRPAEQKVFTLYIYCYSLCLFIHLFIFNSFLPLMMFIPSAILWQSFNKYLGTVILFYIYMCSVLHSFISSPKFKICLIIVWLYYVTSNTLLHGEFVCPVCCRSVAYMSNQFSVFSKCVHCFFCVNGSLTLHWVSNCLSVK